MDKQFFMEPPMKETDRNGKCLFTQTIYLPDVNFQSSFPGNGFSISGNILCVGCLAWLRCRCSYIEHHETKHLIWSSSSHKIPFILMDTSKYNQTVVLQLYEIELGTCVGILLVLYKVNPTTHINHTVL